MNMQFTYTEQVEKKTDMGNLQVPVTHSFSMDKVIRTIGMENGTRLVLLNDIHERSIRIPVTNSRGREVGVKKERDVFQSEIYLSPTDSLRFLEFVDKINKI